MACSANSRAGDAPAGDGSAARSCSGGTRPALVDCVASVFAARVFPARLTSHSRPTFSRGEPPGRPSTFSPSDASSVSVCALFTDARVSARARNACSCDARPSLKLLELFIDSGARSRARLARLRLNDSRSSITAAAGR